MRAGPHRRRGRADVHPLRGGHCRVLPLRVQGNPRPMPKVRRRVPAGM